MTHTRSETPRAIAGLFGLCCALGCVAESSPDVDTCLDEGRLGLLTDREDCGTFAGAQGSWTGQPLFSLTEGYLRRFCRYSWVSVDAAPPDLYALPDAGDGVVGVSRDCPVVIPQADGADARLQELIHAIFEARVGQPIFPQGQLGEHTVTISLVDTIPESLVTRGLTPNTRHGLTLRELIEGLVCDEDRCIANVVNSLGLPRLDGGRLDHELGGYYGSLSDLARGVVDATGGWLQRGDLSHHVILLAVGWEPRDQLGPKALLDAPIELLLTPAAIDSVPPAVQAILAALAHASCKGALVVASAGNENTAACEQPGPVGPGFLARRRAPNPDECKALGFGVGPDADDSGPLVHAVSHVDLDGAPASNARPGATATLVAPGVAFGTAAGDGEMLTGSSVAAAATAATVAWLWSHFPELSGPEVMEIVYESGRPLPGAGTSDFQLGDRPLEARQVSACDALIAACSSTGAAGCDPPPSCPEPPDGHALALHAATVFACARESTPMITLGSDFEGSAAANACGQTTTTWPSTPLPATDPSPWPWAEPTPPVTYCPRCIAIVGTAPQHLTAGLALTAEIATDEPVLLEVRTAKGIHQYPLSADDLLPDRTNLVEVLPAEPWSDILGVRLVYFVHDLRGELVTRGDPLLVLGGGGSLDDVTCPPGVCGDGIVAPSHGEQCDDGNQTHTDQCTNACKRPICGDGIVTPSRGEQCDDLNQSNSDKCNTTCKLTRCGDGVKQEPNGTGTGGNGNYGDEACDDGNLINNDACTNTCTLNPN